MEDADGKQFDARHPIWHELDAAKGTYGEALKAAKAEARRPSAPFCSGTNIEAIIDGQKRM
jgi:hypothetical protein